METNRHPQLYFFVLLVTGIGVCLPKLFRPMRIEKQGYREVADWLRQNSKPQDTIAVPDKRISFYANRRGLSYEDEKIPDQAEYVVAIVKNEQSKFARIAQEQYSVWVDVRKKSGKRLVVYRMK